MNFGRAKDILVSKLVTLPPHADVFDAIHLLLKHRITGAPVIDETGQLLGVFSDKSCMNVLAAALSNWDDAHPLGVGMQRDQPADQDVLCATEVHGETSPASSVQAVIRASKQNEAMRAKGKKQDACLLILPK